MSHGSLSQDWKKCLEALVINWYTNGTEITGKVGSRGTKCLARWVRVHLRKVRSKPSLEGLCVLKGKVIGGGMREWGTGSDLGLGPNRVDLLTFVTDGEPAVQNCCII